MRRSTLTLLLATTIPLAPAPTHAQNGAALRVFLDCQSMHCDFNHLRREIGFVNWVRDRQVAEIHVLGTSQGTGGGGRVFTLTFIGRDRFAGRVDTLKFVRNATDTFAEERDGLTRTLALGLVPFVAGTALSDRITITYEVPTVAEPAGPVDDPWDYWVFRTDVSGSTRAEEQFRRHSGSGRITASRTTEALKVFVGVRGSYRWSESILGDSLDADDNVVLDSNTGDTLTSKFVDERTDWGAFSQAVWSLGPHWSVGGRLNLGSSTFSNEDLSIEVGPALEFSIFPYSESSRRAATVLYAVAVAHFNWEEMTIFGKLRETRPIHQLEFDVEAQQPWGGVGGGIEIEQFLDNLAQHRIEISGGIGVRLIRGLEFNVSGSFARVKNQINLVPEAGLSQKEILVRRRELGTEFEYRANMGFSYTFGSIFNNIVNTRF